MKKDKVKNLINDWIKEKDINYLRLFLNLYPNSERDVAQKVADELKESVREMIAERYEREIKKKFYFFQDPEEELEKLRKKYIENYKCPKCGEVYGYLKSEDYIDEADRICSGCKIVLDKVNQD